MQLKTIKYLNDGVILAWKVPIKGGFTDTHSMSSGEDPRPDFIKVLNSLKPYLVSLGEIESIDKKLIHVTGVSLSYKGEMDTMHAIITGHRTYRNSGGCSNENTPIKATENSTGEELADENLLPEKCVKIIKDLIEEAKKYIKGERSQGKLKLEKPVDKKNRKPAQTTLIKNKKTTDK